MNDLKESFERRGYLVLPDFIPAKTCEGLRLRAQNLIAALNPEEGAFTFSSYLRDQAQTQADYVRDSASKISFFFEENAFDVNGILQRPAEQSLCKIGHALHDCDPVFDEFSRSAAIARIAKEVGFRNPLLSQSMYLFKQPGIGAEIACHQDATFIYTSPSSVVGFWFALEDATIENGCLWVLPRGHENGLKSRFVRTPQGDVFENYDSLPSTEDQFIPLEVKQGSLVLLHGFLPHFSKANRSLKSRHAYTLHLIEGDYDYPKDNWIQRPTDNPFRGF